MATSGTKTVKVTGYNNLVFNWELISQSVEDNTSTISWKMLLTSDGSSGKINSNVTKPWKVTVNGTEYSGKVSHGIGANTTKTLASGNTIIQHNVDGSKIFSYYFFMTFEGLTFSGVAVGNKSGSGSDELPKIERFATITAAPNFNDEENPTITYSNPAGDIVTVLRACISLDGSQDDVAYRDIDKEGSTYTFNLTEAERKVLRKATTTSNSREVRFYVMTEIGGETYRKYLSKTLTIINADPTLNPTAIDNGSVSTVLTGDADGIIISGYNSIQVAANASAKKEATIKSYKISCGGKSITTATGSLGRVTSGDIVFSVTDSRGNTTTKTLTRTLINYIKLTCNLDANAPTTDGDMTFTVSGNYFNGSFGAVDNTLTVQYRIKEDSGAYGDWIVLTPTLNEKTYKATGNITGLNYRSTYTIQARAVDKIYNGNTEPDILSAEKKVKTTPIFDWGEEDFAFHVPVYMDNANQIYTKDAEGDSQIMMSLNASNQAFFGYGLYSAGKGTSYFDGNAVNIRSKGNITNTASGTIGGNKAWTNSSDSRLKADIGDVPQVLVDVWYDCKPQMFRWKDGNTLQIGLIAQDVIEVFNKHDLDWRDYGFVSTLAIDGVEYYAITYEFYNMLTAIVLRGLVLNGYSSSN